MVRVRHVSVLTILAFMVITFEETSALKCWRCASDAPDASFCYDKLDESKMSDRQKRWSYVECTAPVEGSATKVVCMKVKDVVNDEVVYWRLCHIEKEDVPRNTCMNTTIPSYVKREFCETCSTDGCNI